MNISISNKQWFTGKLLAIGLIYIILVCESCTSCQSNKDDSHSGGVEVEIGTKNEDVKEYLEKELNASTEDEKSSYSEEQKKEVQATQEKRSKILNEELNASSFKDSTDEEIMSYLGKELDRYQSTCDTATFNGIRRLMNRDARFKIFSANQIEFSQEFRSRIKEAMEKCKSSS